MYTCRECERPINQATEICPYCGTDLTQPAFPEEPKPEQRPSVASVLLRWGIIVAGLWALLWFTLPDRGGDRPAQAEASALQAMREIRSELVAYAETQGSYPNSLEALGERARKPAQQTQTLGYRLHYMPGAPDSDGVVRSFALQARAGHYGYRNFYLDQTGLVRATRENRPATAEDPPI